MQDSSREITDDYISFTVVVEYEQLPSCYKGLKRFTRGHYVYTVHYKYSFKRVPDPLLKDPGYTPYVYTGEQDPLLKKYGYFRTVREAIARDNRDKNIFYMNRWNPEKKHIFYFTKEYPEKYKPLAYGVICHINKLFARHGLNNYPLNGKCTEDGMTLPGKGETCNKGICFELHENTGQKFGDIRYSFFQILESNVPLLGYGPSDAHPATGEIISGNVILSVYALDFYLKYLLQEPYKRDHKEYRDEKGNLVKQNPTKWETSSLFSEMKETLKEDDHSAWTKTSSLINRDSALRPVFEYLLSELTFGYPPWSRFTRASGLFSRKLSFNTGQISQFVPDMPGEYSHGINEVINHVHEDMEKSSHQPSSHVIYPVEPVIAQLPGLLANGMAPEEVKKRILFGLMVHEFGHVLNLRHNFYGSVDTRHWFRNSEGNPVMETSSVMDYRDFSARVGPLRALFGSYDEAALVYAYSSGKKDLSRTRDTSYLYCTDRHRPLNALCNSWDSGSTPSEIMLNLIENYEEFYFIRNLRINRAYWDTSSYPMWILRDMWDIKRALMMWRTAFRSTYISEALDKTTRSYTDYEKTLITSRIGQDIRQAIKLSMAFYNSVLQLSRADRDWQTFYNRESGAVERIGIAHDKLFAMLFLMGDEGFVYNPNHFLDKASYLSYIDELGFRQMIEEIMENTLTVRVDMEPWFIDLARFLYAQSASNHYNLSKDGSLLEKIGLRCYTPKGLKNRLGVDPQAYSPRPGSPAGFLDTGVVSMSSYLKDIKDPYYMGTNEKLGITFFDGNYYVAASNLNKYSFTIIDKMKRETHSDNRSLRQDKQDVYDMFYLYQYFKNKGEISTCDNGE